MKGDFSRSTFEKTKHYSKVHQQQGRVNLDSDWNEQSEINTYFQRNTSKEIIGITGASIDNAGFKIIPIFVNPSTVAPGPNYMIQSGRYFVDGILCENENNVSAKMQPDLTAINDRDNPALPMDAGTYLVYLDVWEKHVTSLEDPDIREVALGGADTTTRSKIVWQVKTQKIGNFDNDDLHCLSDISFWNDLTNRQLKAALTVRTSSKNQNLDSCELPPDTSYQGLENQLYRIEIHDYDHTSELLTVKWSRNNGFVVARIHSVNVNTVTLQNLGKDEVLGFQQGDWVEIIDDQMEMLGKPGLFAQITDIDDLNVTLSVVSSENDDASPNSIQEIILMSARPKIRKWDVKDGLLEISKTKRSDSSDANDSFWFEIEDGIEIKIGTGKFQPDDYWLVPARTATHDIIWPKDDDGTSLPQPPAGVDHHYARLAILKFDGTKIDAASLTDCRRLFPDLTSLSNLRYVGGNGQVGKKNTSLLLPLKVGVSNGKHPLEGIDVEFEVKSGNGAIIPTDTTTDSDGIAQCVWTLGASEPQQVMAVMKDKNGQSVHLPVWFNATIQQDGKSGNCSISIDPTDVSDGGTSLSKRIQELQTSNGGKICLSSGQYILSDTVTIHNLNNITIEGTGNSTQLIIQNKETALHFVQCKNICIDKVKIVSANPSGKLVDQSGLGGVLTFTNCHEITVSNSKLKSAHGFRPTRSCLVIYGSSSSPSSNNRIHNCSFELGSMQIGILATNISDLIVENNHLKTISLKSKVLPAKKSDLFKHNTMLELLISRLGGRGMSAETFTTINTMEAGLINLFQTALDQNATGNHSGAIKTMNNAKKTIIKIDETIALGKETSQLFVDNEILKIFDRAKKEHAEISSLLDDGIRSANGQKYEEAKMLWKTASAKEGNTHELIKIASSLSKRAIDDNVVNTDKSKNQKIVYAAATWNFDKNDFTTSDFKKIKGLRQDISPGYQGIVIGGMVADKVKIQNNILKRMVQGIHVGLSNNIKTVKNQSIHAVKNIMISGNVVESEFSSFFPRQKHGIFIGNADSAYIQDNQIILKRTNHANIKFKSDPASEGISGFGYYGTMLRIVGNNVVGADKGISVTSLGFLPTRKYGLWILRENVVTDYSLYPYHLAGKTTKLKDNILFGGRDNLPELSTSSFIGSLVYISPFKII